MNEISLVYPDESLSPQIAAYRRAFIEVGDSMDGCGSLSRMPDPADWLAQCRALSDPASVPDNLVPSTQFAAVRQEDGALVGMIQIRHCFNAYLERYGGHIGYSVHPAARRRGYAARMLGTVLPYCRSIGLRRVLVTCDADNEACRRTILKNGGAYESTVFEPEEGVWLERYWIDTRAAGTKPPQNGEDI